MPRPETCLRSPSDGFKRCSRCERDFSPAVEYRTNCELPPPPDIEDSLPGERRPLADEGDELLAMDEAHDSDPEFYYSYHEKAEARRREDEATRGHP